MTTTRGFYTTAKFGYYNMVKNIWEADNFIEEVEFSDLVIMERRDEMISDGGYDKDDEDLDSYVYDSLYEDLACWTIYFEPRDMEEQIALDCNLVPFTYKDTELLALAGAGMDLSPKLDAYQALVGGHIDDDSMYFKQRGYFVSVVGKRTTERVEKEIMKDWRYQEKLRIDNNIQGP